MQGLISHKCSRSRTATMLFHSVVFTAACSSKCISSSAPRSKSSCLSALITSSRHFTTSTSRPNRPICQEPRNLPNQDSNNSGTAIALPTFFNLPAHISRSAHTSYQSHHLSSFCKITYIFAVSQKPTRRHTRSLQRIDRNL